MVALLVALISTAVAGGFQYYVTAQEIVFLNREIERVGHEQALLRPKLERRDALLAERGALEHKQAFLAGLIARRWAPVLRELAALTPVNLNFRQVEYVEPNELVLTGRTPQLEPIAQLMAGIDRSPLLTRARVSHAIDEEGMYNFEVRLQVR
jgi:Tfp pilus assembly protein PilN